MKRILFLIMAVLMVMKLLYAQDQAVPAPQKDPELEALKLAIENTMSVRVFEKSYYSNDITTTVVVIPINMDILSSIITYKCKFERLSKEKYADILHKQFDKYINGNMSSFAIFIFNKMDKPNENKVFFKDGLGNNVELYDDFKQYRLLGYTKNFDTFLSPGENNGYLHFENFRKNNAVSYSIKFTNLNLEVNSTTSQQYVWSFSFDNSELNILSLLSKGIDQEKIREKYGIKRFSDFALDANFVLGIINTLVTTIAMI